MQLLDAVEPRSTTARQITHSTPAATDVPVTRRAFQESASRVTVPTRGAVLRYTGANVLRASARVRIAGEPFFVEREDDSVIIRHAAWSLMGVGGTLVEAEHDLRAEARDVREALLKLRPSELSSEALRLRDFVLRLG